MGHSQGIDLDFINTTKLKVWGLTVVIVLILGLFAILQHTHPEVLSVFKPFLRRFRRIWHIKERRMYCARLNLAFQRVFREPYLERMMSFQPRFVCAAISDDGRMIAVVGPQQVCSDAHHWPTFQVAVDGTVASEAVLVSSVPDYQSATESTLSPTPELMLSAEMLRNSVQPLGVNTSLNRGDNMHVNFGGNFGGNYSSGFRGQEHVPVNNPLFVNTSMNAQQRIDLYNHLSVKPQDEQPALLFRNGF